MSVRGRMRPLAVNAAAAIIGAVVSIAVLRMTPIEAWIASDRDALQTIAPKFEKLTGRVASTPPSLPRKTVAVADPPLWRSSVMPQREADLVTGALPRLSAGTTGLAANSDTGAWSTDVQRVRLPSVTAPSPTRAVRPKSERRSRGTRKKSRPRKRWQSAALKSRLKEISPRATKRLIAKFRTANAFWPPTEIAFVGIKDERVLELHARSEKHGWKPIYRYRVLAASGGAGPKLRQGDRQVPEGIYRIVYLNPKSAYHVSLRVNYPNKFDRRMAAKEGRKKLGGDIMIHGKRSSAGCLAMGDPAVEELFVLAAQTGYSRVKTIIAPTDFRRHGLPSSKPGQPKWLPKLYMEIASAMSEFKAPRPAPSLLSFFSLSN